MRIVRGSGKCTLLLITILTLCCPLTLSAASFSKKDLVGKWNGNLGDYKSKYTFASDGTYKGVISVVGQKMISIGVWELDNNMLHLDQKKAIEAGEKSNFKHRYTRKITLLDKNQLNMVHKNGLGEPVKSSYKRVK